MNNKRLPIAITLFSTAEIFIGLFTMLVVYFSIALGFNSKPINVLVFVYTTSVLSFLLGIGLIRLNRQAYELLIFLSSVIILSKLLIFFNIIQLNGALETAISPGIKNIVSIVYHATLLIYLKSKAAESLFKKI
jgi:hypothetical protein